MSHPTLSALLCELNPDDLITELSRCCGLARWAFRVREALLSWPSSASDEELRALLSSTWEALSPDEQLEALQLTPPLSLSVACWGAILKEEASPTQEATLSELTALSARYQASLDAPLPLAPFVGLTAQEARALLLARLERPREEERSHLKGALVERAWRELQGLRAREALEGPSH